METTAPKTIHTLPSDTAPAAAASSNRRRAKKGALILGSVAGVVILAIAGYALLTAGEEGTDDAQVEADVVPLSARVGGQVLHTLVKDNDSVKKGDVILEIDPAEPAARLQQAQAELATAQAQEAAAEQQANLIQASAKGGFRSARAVVSSSSTSVLSADAQISAAKAGLERAKAEARRAELDLDRNKQLRAANAVTQERLDNAQSAYDVAQAGLAQAQAQLAAAEEARHVAQSRVAEAQGRLESVPIDAQIAAAKANVSLAQARVQSAAAQLKLAELQLSYTKITAPESGVVSKLSAHEGQLLQVGQAVAELVPNKTYVVANFKETQIGRMRPGQRATVHVDAYPGQNFEAKVESLSGGTGAQFSLLPPDNASGNYVKVVQRVPVRLAWVNPPPVPLKAGLSVDATVYVGGH